MPSWQDEYLGALQQRDRYEKANEKLYENYAKLADRTATLQQATLRETLPIQVESKSASPKPPDRKASKGKDAHGIPALGDPIAKVRQDLSEAQRSRGLMETRLQSVTEELQKLKIQSSLDSQRIRELTKESATFARGLKDRNEELKGKAKFLEDMHDETVSLTLQLNMADERSQKLEKENKELVDRWMKRMAQEADAMNDKSKFS